jgi:hypothetical protein
MDYNHNKPVRGGAYKLGDYVLNQQRSKYASNYTTLINFFRNPEHEECNVRIWRSCDKFPRMWYVFDQIT